MPTYEHHCGHCSQNFDDFYSIKADPPLVCNLCGAPGKVVRLISGGSGRGVVEVVGYEFKEKVKAETTDMIARAHIDENYRANLIGEDKYQGNLKIEDKVREVNKTRPKIKYGKSR